MGGGGFSMEPDNPRLDDFILGLAGRDRPRVCFLPTPTDDDDGFVDWFRATFADRCEPSVLRLVDPAARSPLSLLDDQDVVYVPGGNTVRALAVWRATGADAALRAAWERGTLLCGLSAGSLCWFESGVTDSASPDGSLTALTDGLGFLPGSHCPHYHSEPGRRSTYLSLVASGALPAGYAVDDFAALHVDDGKLVEVVASRPDAHAYRVERVGDTARETRLDGRVLA
jgi:peptidase E